MNSRILTVPNQLTFLRLAFLPFFIMAIHYERYNWALVILIVAGFTDALDGFLARGLNQKTPLGAYLDPIADKLLLSSSYFVLALHGKVAWWLTILVLGRDVLLLVASAVILITVGYMSLPPSIYGKATTFFEITMIFLVLVLALRDNHALYMLKEICGYCVAAFVCISGVHYSIVVSRRSARGRIGQLRPKWRTEVRATTSKPDPARYLAGVKNAERHHPQTRRNHQRGSPAQQIRALPFFRRRRRAIHHDFSESKSADESAQVRGIVDSRHQETPLSRCKSASGSTGSAAFASKHFAGWW